MLSQNNNTQPPSYDTLYQPPLIKPLQYQYNLIYKQPDFIQPYYIKPVYTINKKENRCCVML